MTRNQFLFVLPIFGFIGKCIIKKENSPKPKINNMHNYQAFKDWAEKEEVKSFLDDPREMIGQRPDHFIMSPERYKELNHIWNKTNDP